MSLKIWSSPASERSFVRKLTKEGKEEREEWEGMLEDLLFTFKLLQI